MAGIKRALISVSNKAGVVLLARELREMGVEIISTGGTEKRLLEEGIEVIPISDITGFKEMLDGRVKTLHPHIHGAILADRTKPEHLRELEELGITSIDLVVVNLYPFAETISNPDSTLADAVEQIDIGGVALIRASAKNFHSVAIVTDPTRYSGLLLEMRQNNGEVSMETRQAMAAEAFRHTSDYDNAINSYLARQFDEFPGQLSLSFRKADELRYGENPHQRAAFYKEVGGSPGSLANAEKLHGKALSFNNMLDLDASWALVREFEEPAAAVIKHNTPCGAAVAATVAEAYTLAFDSDPLSAFGGIVAFNREVDEDCARRIVAVFQEAVIAPSYSEAALEVLTGKADLRIMRLAIPQAENQGDKDFKHIEGGLLVQDCDRSRETREDFKLVTSRKPTEQEWQDLLFSWKVAKHVRSNAIVLAKDRVTVGIGAGQLSRVEAVWVALHKAGDKAAGCVLGSDAFFPFPDALEAAAQAGVTCFAEPGGSLKDQAIKETAEKLGVSLVFTGFRHFRH
jgi:phosphoribosylaminoimidazolecarboxamide formyltransferase / IMP cyclohydrolase